MHVGMLSCAQDCQMSYTKNSMHAGLCLLAQGEPISDEIFHIDQSRPLALVRYMHACLDPCKNTHSQAISAMTMAMEILKSEGWHRV